VAIVLYLMLNPEPQEFKSSILLIDTGPLTDHAAFWGSWAAFYFCLIGIMMKSKQPDDSAQERARQHQITQIEDKLARARQAYRRGSTSLYALTALCACCSFFLYTKLPATLTGPTFWQLQSLFICIPVFAAIFYGMGARVPLTTLLSIANSPLKRVYTVSVVFFSLTATGMCLALMVNHMAEPLMASLRDNSIMQQTHRVSAPGASSQHGNSNDQAAHDPAITEQGEEMRTTTRS
jgi:hypothetical protein